MWEYLVGAIVGAMVTSWAGLFIAYASYRLGIVDGFLCAQEPDDPRYRGFMEHLNAEGGARRLEIAGILARHFEIEEGT